MRGFLWSGWAIGNITIGPSHWFGSRTRRSSMESGRRLPGHPTPAVGGCHEVRFRHTWSLAAAARLAMSQVSCLLSNPPPPAPPLSLAVAGKTGSDGYSHQGCPPLTTWTAGARQMQARRRVIAIRNMACLKAWFPIFLSFFFLPCRRRASVEAPALKGIYMRVRLCSKLLGFVHPFVFHLM